MSVYERTSPLDLRHDLIRAADPSLLIVEILSPTQGSFELMQRIDRYLDHGVKSCWIVYPTSHTITVYTAEAEEKTWSEGIAKDSITGLSADLERVFP